MSDTQSPLNAPGLTSWCVPCSSECSYDRAGSGSGCRLRAEERVSSQQASAQAEKLTILLGARVNDRRALVSEPGKVYTVLLRVELLLVLARPRVEELERFVLARSDELLALVVKGEGSEGATLLVVLAEDTRGLEAGENVGREGESRGRCRRCCWG